ncbi:MAG: YqeB family protein [Actinomycetaceae bacterium]
MSVTQQPTHRVGERPEADRGLTVTEGQDAPGQGPRTRPSVTRVGVRVRRRLFLLLGIPAIGLVFGLLVVLVIEVVAQVTAFGGVLGHADRLGEPVGLLVGAGVGLGVGAIVAAGALRESMSAEISERAISVMWDDARVCVRRGIVGQIVVGEDLVVLGRGGVELARVPQRLSSGPLLRALAEHGYPAPRDDDPHAAAFATWTPGDDLDEAAERLLTARAAAVRAGQHGDAELLRRQLARRGVMVRDRSGRPAEQQWRRAAGRPPAAAAA